MRSSRKELQDRIRRYTCHREFKPKLVRRVKGQVRELGIEYVVHNISDEARELYLKSREVGGEYHRAISFMRFQEKGEFLVSKAEFEHEVVEAVLRHFMSRFPMKTIAIVARDRAFLGANGAIAEESPERYLAMMERKPEGRDELWETFYDSQYIEGRRNRRLAMKSIPKKLWKKFGIKEGKNIDKGIPSRLLSDFMG